VIATAKGRLEGEKSKEPSQKTDSNRSSVKAACRCELKQWNKDREEAEIKVFLKGRINNLIGNLRSLIKN
jgi:hypothetical protein